MRAPCSYDGVVKAFATKSVVLPAWLHYVVFDLWTGNWEVRCLCCGTHEEGGSLFL